MHNMAYGIYKHNTVGGKTVSCCWIIGDTHNFLMKAYYWVIGGAGGKEGGGAIWTVGKTMISNLCIYVWIYQENAEHDEKRRENKNKSEHWTIIIWNIILWSWHVVLIHAIQSFPLNFVFFNGKLFTLSLVFFSRHWVRACCVFAYMYVNTIRH